MLFPFALLALRFFAAAEVTDPTDPYPLSDLAAGRNDSQWKIKCVKEGPGCVNVTAAADRVGEYASTDGMISIRTLCKLVHNRQDSRKNGFFLREAIPCPPGEMCRFKIRAQNRLDEGLLTKCVPVEAEED